jgi:hypothetical protein
MALAISSTRMYVPFHVPSLDIPYFPTEVITLVEYKRRSILLDSQERRRRSTNGLLSGLLVWPLAPQPGVGTYSVPQIVTPLKARAQKYVNMVIANHRDEYAPLADAEVYLVLSCPYRRV